jgi:hypothetical protein
MNDHFIIPADLSYTRAKGVWFKEPTHFVAWAIPDESFFEASALEEYLIYKQKGKVIGYNA